MLPHQGYSRPENPKRHGFDSSIKLSPLQNHGLSDRHAYLRVRTGHPVNPRAPTRSGLIDDEAMRALHQWIENRIFDWVCSQELPEAVFVERLYAINRQRAEQECPFAIIRQWKPLPKDYVFDSSDDAQSQEGGESDLLGPRQVVRKGDLATVLVLDESVTCPLPSRGTCGARSNRTRHAPWRPSW